MADPFKIIMEEVNDHTGNQEKETDDNDPFSCLTRHVIDS
jgi:hypothetical protein